ncbi:MAG: alpha/beta hydrolase, partial [Acidimicrobiia bacterium]|nr:alpha/beta hydrolase [Acidimicrobiia bacterium]
MAVGKLSAGLAAATILVAPTSNGESAPDSRQDLGLVRTVPSFDGIPITYEVHGRKSPTLVFVHGWSCDRRYWREQLEPFSHEYRVVAIDLAGHGDSGSGRQEPTIRSFGADVAAVVRELGLERVVLIGHSMGGDVIM